MKAFDPRRDVSGSGAILVDGAWPNFHDAEVHRLEIWRGDVRPEADRWIGPRIDTSFELCALRDPFLVRLRFHDCERIELAAFNHQNAIYDLEFSLEPRGQDLTGADLPPWIRVRFEPAFGMRLAFRCARVEVRDPAPS